MANHKKICTRSYPVSQVFGEEAKKRAFTLTDDAIAKLDYQAQQLGITSALLINALIKCCLKSAGVYYKEQGFTPTEDKHLIKQRHNGIKSKRELIIAASIHSSLNSYARKYKESKSEILECLIRANCWNQAEKLLVELTNK